MKPLSTAAAEKARRRDGFDFHLAGRAVASVDMLLKYASRIVEQECERPFRMAQTKVV